MDGALGFLTGSSLGSTAEELGPRADAISYAAAMSACGGPSSRFESSFVDSVVSCGFCCFLGDFEGASWVCLNGL